MIKAFTIAMVSCQRCKQGVQMSPNIVWTLEDVEAMATAAHKSTGVICGNPRLIIVYSDVLVADEIKADADKGTIVAANGNGHARP